MDMFGTRSWTRFYCCAATLLSLWVSGCLPAKGTPVFVQRGAADLWSGKGVLIEVSPDQRLCRVVFRDSHLVTREDWIECTKIHPRKL